MGLSVMDMEFGIFGFETGGVCNGRAIHDTNLLCLGCERRRPVQGY